MPGIAPVLLFAIIIGEAAGAFALVRAVLAFASVTGAVLHAAPVSAMIASSSNVAKKAGRVK